MRDWFKQNIFNILIALLIAIPICICAHCSRNGYAQSTEPSTWESEPVEEETLESETEVVKVTEVIEIIVSTRLKSETEIETETEPTIEYVSLGTFRITAYCSCKKCCGKWADSRPLDENGNPIVYGASGSVLIPEYSVAVDPKVIPYGTKLYFNGNEYIAHDCGGAIKGNDLDLYFDSHEEARKWGVKRYEVFIVKEE